MTRSGRRPARRRSVRVAVLGCGNVGGALVGMLLDPGRRHRRPQPASASSSPASPCATRHARGRRASPPTCSPPTPPRWSTDPAVDVVVELIGGLDPARELIRGGARSGQARGDGQQGAAGRPTASRLADAGRDRRRRPAVRGGGGRRDPAGPAAARVAGRRADPAGDGDRQRDDQLHPHPDGARRAPTTPTCWPRPRRSGWPSATRRRTWRGTTPPPRRPSWPRWPSGATWSTPTCTARASRGIQRRRRRLRRPARLRR